MSENETQEVNEVNNSNVSETVAPPAEDTSSGDAGGHLGNAFTSEVESSSSEEQPSFNLEECEFDDPSDFEAAKSQLGRMKPYMAKLKEELKSSKQTIPETYEVHLGKELKDANLEVNNDDPLLGTFKSLAKDANLSQEQFDNVVNFYIKNEMAAQKGMLTDSEAHVQDVIASLGDTPQKGMERLRSLTSQFVEAGLEEKTINALQECLSIDADAIIGMEKLLKSTRYAHSGELQQPSVPLAEERQKLLDDMSTTEYQTNPIFKNRVIKKLGEIHQKMVDTNQKVG